MAKKTKKTKSKSSKSAKAAAGKPLFPDGLAKPGLANVILALMGVGLVVAFIMVQHHEIALYAGADKAPKLPGCNEGVFDCGKVNTSEWSDINLTDDLKLPIALMAIPTYVVIGFLAFMARRRNDSRPMAWAFSIGVLTVVHSITLLLYSKLQLDTFCPWCMGMYSVNILFTICAWLAVSGPPQNLVIGTLKDLTSWPSAMKQAAVVFVVVFGVSFGAQRVYHGWILGETSSARLDAAETGGSASSDDVKIDPKGVLPPHSWDIPWEDGSKSGKLEVKPDDIFYGNPEAKVVLIEFADLECGFCKRLAGELGRVKEAYKDDLLFVFKHFPMNPDCNPGVKNRMHRNACTAAQASECAREQGKFWAYHDLVFKNQHKLDPASLELYAGTIGLNLSEYKTCMRGKESRARVYAGGDMGNNIDIHGTPRLFLDGELYRGARTAEAIAAAIDRKLGAASADNKAKLAETKEAAPVIRPIPDNVPEMTEIKYGDLHFLIDTFEATIEDGKAVSAKDKIPATGATWIQADKACKAAGKRMCEEREWLAVCQGALPIDDNGNGQYGDDMIEGTAYPYADDYLPNFCWDAKDRDIQRPVYTGNMPGCVSKDGVYDLVGNVEEWVGLSKETALLMGGAYDTGATTRVKKARCYRPNDTFGAGFGAYRNGFRCCKNP